MKKCPQCAEEVKVEALVCRFCGYKFDRRAAILMPIIFVPIAIILGGLASILFWAAVERWFL